MFIIKIFLNDFMRVDLSLIGMEKGKQYETIITTENSDNIKHSAPIGVLCSGKDTILCRIFKGGTTLNNILSQKKFIVNITHNPELFYLSTVGNLPENYFNDNNAIKDIDAYFKCEVISFKEAKKQSDPIRKNGEAIVIKSRVTDIVIKNKINALNRSFGYVIESLANLTRFDIVDENQRKYYVERFMEAHRVVNKVGYKEEKQAMGKIKKELMKKGYLS